ncbi:MAG: DeoR/GlpR family DNA-binding transcription regulator [Anaerolineae bacterium]|nr:DeoR/GlpR family DNA-binding transcription regulator [Anaerolineae bacterium]
MTTFERRQNLLDLIRKQPGLSVKECADVLQVSEGTIRNDLNSLAEQKLITRVRGGGTINPDLVYSTNTGFSMRTSLNESAKRAIGREAARLVSPGDAILLDASTTVYHMAQFLMHHNHLRVVTNGIEVGRLLAKNPTNTVLLVGGMLREGSQSVLGPWSEHFLKDLCTKLAFVSCSGFTPEGGMTEVNVFEAQFRIQSIGATTEVIALVDSGKFGKIDLSTSLRVNQISHLYTDEAISQEFVKRLENSAIKYTICKRENGNSL